MKKIIKNQPWPLITGIVLHLYPLAYYLINDSSLGMPYSDSYSWIGITIFRLASRFVYPLLMCLFCMLLVGQWPDFGLVRSLMGLALSSIYPIYLLIDQHWMYWSTKGDAATYGMVLPAVWVAVIIVLLIGKRRNVKKKGESE